jgi:hypothetical protein
VSGAAPRWSGRLSSVGPPGARFRVWIVACGVASATSIQDARGNLVPGTFKGDGNGVGYGMMRRLASVTPCTAQAYINPELGPDFWPGPSVLAYPNGGFVRP